MKLHTSTNTLNTSGITEQKKFEIHSSAHAFKILSSGLYRDKILAIIRELSCNAYDAHKAANKSNKPFKLQLPTSLDPMFIIRDYGHGLCHEDMMELYTTYFQSTKTNSNKFIGALGLGSKSPFSYTESFIVNSYTKDNTKQVTKRSYQAFIDEQGLPNISLMDEQLSDQSSGLEIQFFINESDRYIFAAKTKQALKYFKVKPTIIGVDFYFDEIYFIHECKDWRITEHECVAKALQGNIAYTILSGPIKNFPSYLQPMLGLGFVIDFKIGQLEFAPSREDLSYDNRTSEIIISKLKKIYIELKKDFENRINKQSSKWYALIEYRKILNELSSLSYKNLIRSFKLAYDDEILKDSLTIDITDVIIDNDIKLCQYSSITDTTKWFTTASSGIRIPVNENATIIFNDVKNKFWDRIKYYARQLEYSKRKNLIIIYVNSKSLFEDSIARQNVINQVSTALGNPDYLLTSNFDLPITHKKSNKEYCNLICNADNEYTPFNSYSWKREYVNEPPLYENIIYINISGYKPIKTKIYFQSNFDKLYKAAVQFKLILPDTKIYGIRKCNQKFLTDSCTDFVTLINDFFNRPNPIFNDIRQYNSMSDDITGLCPINATNLCHIAEKCDKIPKNDILFQVTNQIKLSRKLKTDKLLKFYNSCNRILNFDKTGNNTTDSLTKLIEQYPLLEFFINGNKIKDNQLKSIIQFINTKKA